MKAEQIAKAKEILNEAEAIIITASNGLSITEGLHIFANNETFRELLGDFEEKYGFHNVLMGFFYPWKTQEEKWGFYSRVISYFSGNYTGSNAMKNLKKVIGHKPYFIVTSNAEGHFSLAGFEEDSIYEVEMSWLKMRCAKNCQNEWYPSLEAIKKMASLEKDGKVPFEAIPKCPKCGAVMKLYETNPVDSKVAKNWNAFLENCRGKQFVVLELGIGSRNQLIKAPMIDLVYREKNASYITINLGDLYIPREIENRSVGIDGYLDEVLEALAN